MFCCKYLAGSAILLFLISCNDRPKNILKFVNDQNDGWNAFSITLRDNNTYKRQDFGSSYTGKYKISDNHISLGEEVIVFTKTASGCIYKAKYISNGNSTDMRVVFDSLFCDHIPRQKLIGNWVYETSSSQLETLQINETGTAKFGGDNYEKWDLRNSQLFLTKGRISLPLLILRLQEDSLWFRRYIYGSTDTLFSLKAIRSK